MKKFEYKILNYSDLIETVNKEVKGSFFENKSKEYNAATERIFNELGEQGWELVMMHPSNGGGYFFKREVVG